MVLALILLSTITMTVWGVEATGNKITKYTKTTASSIKSKNQLKVATQAKISNKPVMTISNTDTQLSNNAVSV